MSGRFIGLVAGPGLHGLFKHGRYLSTGSPKRIQCPRLDEGLECRLVTKPEIDIIRQVKQGAITLDLTSFLDQRIDGYTKVILNP